MNITFQRAVDRYAGVPLCALFSLLHGLWPPTPSREHPRRILVVLLSEMGSLVLAHGLPDLFQLAAADEAPRIRTVTMAEHEGDRVATGREHEFFEFPRVLALLVPVELEVDENRTLARARPIEKHLSR